jgi:hypothetical protein
VTIKAATGAREKTTDRGTTEVSSQRHGTKGTCLLLGSLVVSMLLAGCVTQSVRNDSMNDLLQQVGAKGKVLLFGTVAGDVNAFTLETSDSVEYQVSQVVKDPGVRLFYFLDVPRSFTIRRVRTESGHEPYTLNADMPVTWLGSSEEGWINSNPIYMGRVDLRFKPKGSGVVVGKIDGSRESEDRGLLQQALSAALSVPRNALPPAGQASPKGR